MTDSELQAALERRRRLLEYKELGESAGLNLRILSGVMGIQHQTARQMTMQKPGRYPTEQHLQRLAEFFETKK